VPKNWKKFKLREDRIEFIRKRFALGLYTGDIIRQCQADPLFIITSIGNPEPHGMGYTGVCHWIKETLHTMAEIDFKPSEELAKSADRLLTCYQEAIKHKQPGAATQAIREMNHMFGLKVHAEAIALKREEVEAQVKAMDATVPPPGYDSTADYESTLTPPGAPGKQEKSNNGKQDNAHPGG